MKSELCLEARPLRCGGLDNSPPWLERSVSKSLLKTKEALWPDQQKYMRAVQWTEYLPSQYVT